MSTTIEIPGRFRYRADVTPKRSRNRRRVLMHAPILHEIASLRRGEVVSGAVQIRTAADQKVSYVLHDGRLWRPADPADPVSIAEYRDAARLWPTLQPDRRYNFERVLPQPLRALAADPIARSQAHTDAVHWPDRGDMALHAEEEFEGEIHASEREAAAARFRDAASDVVVIDEEIYYPAADPVWEATFDGEVDLIAPAPGMYPGTHFSAHHGGRLAGGANAFDVRRADDALAYAKRTAPDKAHPVRGEVLHVDPGYAPPPALAGAVRSACHYLLGNPSYQLSRYLSREGFAAFGALQRAAASATPYRLGELGRDPRVLVEGLRTILADLRTAAFVPDDLFHARRGAIDGILPVLQRADFEAATAPTLEARDEDALVSSMLAVAR